MKTKLIFLLIALTIALGNVGAKNVIKVKANGYDISDNLDLEAVASIFGDSEDLTDFEKRLNDAGSEISNLDLNEDGYVDYLRVIEYTENYVHLITIQAVLANDIYQDVATIELERKDNDQFSMIIVGNHFIYGNDYYLQPVYIHRPTIFSLFFGLHYQPWHSPYYWGYYPTYYRHRKPYSIHRYRDHIYVHINNHHHYEYLSHYDHHYSNDFYSKHGRNDYGSKHPERSFENRNHGVKNRLELDQNRRSGQPNSSKYNRTEKSNRNQPEGNSRRVSTKETERERPSSVKRSTNTPERRSVNDGKSVNKPSQNKSNEVKRTETKRTEDKPVVREKSRSNSDQKTNSTKITKSTNQRSESNTRRSENSVKKQTSEKKEVKKDATEKKSTENKSRR